MSARCAYQLFENQALKTYGELIGNKYLKKYDKYTNLLARKSNKFNIEKSKKEVPRRKYNSTTQGLYFLLKL